MITTNEYEAHAQRTQPKRGVLVYALIPRVSILHDDLIDIFHAASGFCSESAELLDAIDKCRDGIKPQDVINIKEECGDLLWYIALMCRPMQTTFISVLKESDEYETLEIKYLEDLPTIVSRIASCSGHIMDMLKKQCFYGKLAMHKTILEQTIKLTALTVCLCNAMDFSLQDVCDRNIEKLRVRYPEKFTEENAINRDTDKERVVLEK